VYRKLAVRCLPEKIPVKITYDITELDLDGHVAAKDLPLPEGVSIRLAPSQTVLAVVSEKDRGEEDAAVAAAGAAAVPAAGAVAAPAADAKAAAGKGPAADAKAAKPAAAKPAAAAKPSKGK